MKTEVITLMISLAVSSMGGMATIVGWVWYLRGALATRDRELSEALGALRNEISQSRLADQRILARHDDVTAIRDQLQRLSERVSTLEGRS